MSKISTEGGKRKYVGLHRDSGGVGMGQHEGGVGSHGGTLKRVASSWGFQGLGFSVCLHSLVSLDRWEPK
jgi:hypothetical protein